MAGPTNAQMSQLSVDSQQASGVPYPDAFVTPSETTTTMAGRPVRKVWFNPFTPKFKKCILPTFKKEKCHESEVVRVGSINMFHQSKLEKKPGSSDCVMYISVEAAGVI